MSGSVSVLCPNGHRVKVEVGPNTPLNSIKQQVSCFNFLIPSIL